MGTNEGGEDRGWRRRVDEHLASHQGVVAIARAIELGAPPRSLYNEVDRGRLRRPLPGVLAGAQWPSGRLHLMAAVCAWCSAAAIAFTTAGQLWGFRRLPHDLRIHVLVPHRISTGLDGVDVHRCRRIDPVDIVEREDGIRLTSPPRTIFDSADMLGADATASILEQLIDTGRGTVDTHLSTLLRLAHPRRPGTRTMTSVLQSRPAWRSALQSDLEARVLAEIAAQRLPLPSVQHQMRINGRSIRLDFAWPEARVGLEVDHPFWHAGAEESHRDRARDRHLMAIGWVVPRITDVDVATSLAASVAEVATILLQRAAA